MKRINSFFLSLCFITSVYAGDILFPDIEGWQKNARVDHYNADSLWTLIDGAAETFLQFRYVEMQRMEYWQNDSVYFELHVYEYADEFNAFGIYAEERPEDAAFIALGTEGYADDYSVNFLAGQYYIKMHTNNSSGEVRNAMLEVASLLTSRLNPSPALPAVLSLFPPANKIPHSEKLIVKNFLGYDFFNDYPVFQMRYREGKNECFLFIIPAGNDENAGKLMSFFFEDQKISPAAGTVYKVKDPNNGILYLCRKDNSVWGVYNARSQKTAKILLQ